MPSPLRALVAFLLLAAAAPLADAQSLREQVNAAIDRGVEHLIETQLVDGSWYSDQPTYRAGMTGLALYALVECDVPADHPAVLRACEYLFAIEPWKTYEVSVTMLAFAELAPKMVDEALRKRLDERLAKYTALLVSYQDASGGYAYPDLHVDLSNTQYAAMALRAAALRGHEVPAKTWKGIAEYTIAMQEPASKTSLPIAGVRYTADYEPTGSMTAAGVATLHICTEQSKRPGNTWARHQAAALAWLADRFQVNDNPNASGAWHYYYLHTIERIGSMLATSTIGTHDWYHEGATYLVSEQQAGGDWWNLSNTAYALLFLKRATAPSTGAGEPRRQQKSFGTDDPLAPASLRAFGDNPLRIWVSSFGEAELAEYGVDLPGGRSLDVLVCEYWLDQGPGVVEPVVLARFEAPVTDARFAFEHEFQRRGLYTVRAVLTFASPNEGRGSVVVDSAPLDIDVRREDQSELLAIARGLSKNQLIGREIRVHASSWMDEYRDPQYVCDGIHAVGWMTAVVDTDPFVSLAWNDYVECSELRFAHLQEPNCPDSVLPRRLRVTLNGREELEFEMPDSRLEIGVLVFNKKKKLRSLRVDVLDTYETENGAIRPVGLGEIDIRAKKSETGSEESDE
jgi:hypothetical protein